jgi:hypothetical protein
VVESGAVPVGASLVAMAAPGAGTGCAYIAATLVIFGFDQGRAIAPAPAALLELAPREQSGVASAVMSSARRLERPWASPCLARC